VLVAAHDRGSTRSLQVLGQHPQALFELGLVLLAKRPRNLEREPMVLARPAATTAQQPGQDAGAEPMGNEAAQSALLSQLREQGRAQPTAESRGNLVRGLDPGGVDAALGIAERVNLSSCTWPTAQGGID
jgi:hypothetical protein